MEEWTNTGIFSTVGSLRFRVPNSKKLWSKGRGRCQKSNEKKDSLDHGQKFNNGATNRAVAPAIAVAGPVAYPL